MPARTNLSYEQSTPALEPGTDLAAHRTVIGLVARGLSNRQVARELKVSLTTVQRRIRAASEALGTSSRVSLVVCAIEAGLVETGGLCSVAKDGVKTPPTQAGNAPDATKPVKKPNREQGSVHSPEGGLQ